jgi:hypothetical protein
MRVLAERANDFSGSADLHQTAVEKALKVPLVNWVNGSRALNQEEQQSYLAHFDRTFLPDELSSQSITEVLRDGIDGQSERNNAVYVCLVPYEGPPNGKRKLDGTPASRVVASPCPVVPICQGTSLHVMSNSPVHSEPQRTSLRRHRLCATAEVALQKVALLQSRVATPIPGTNCKLRQRLTPRNIVERSRESRSLKVCL